MVRSMGIPAVVGVGAALEALFETGTVVVDGGEGYAVADPDPDTVTGFERKREQIDGERVVLEEYRHVEAHPVPVFEDHVKTRESGDQEQVDHATTADGSR